VGILAGMHSHSDSTCPEVISLSGTAPKWLVRNNSRKQWAVIPVYPSARRAAVFAKSWDDSHDFDRQTKLGYLSRIGGNILQTLIHVAYMLHEYGCHYRQPAAMCSRPMNKKGNAMKTLILSACVALGTVCGMSAIADTVSADGAATGTYVKDSAITTKVKTKLAAKHMSTLTKVSVDTNKDGVVWLSGTAPTKDAKDLAGMITKDTDGVTGVHNNIVVE
jgi:hyperosmotically inducible protein